MIPYGKQSINQSDIDSVISVLQSEFLTQGPVVPTFEKAISGCVGAKYGVAVNSATSALHLACLALGVKSGDCVWTSPNTFVASANCALYCGANVDFVDIDAQTYNISIELLEKKLLQAKATNSLPKALIPVHFAGQSCDMERIHSLSRQFGFYVIEDASHAIGAEFHGQPVGGCQYSDMTVFSFHPVKIITTGEGGLITTNSDSLYDKLVSLRSHGITRDPTKMTHPSHGAWYYQQLELGYNYRLTELQAALGLSQLTRLNEFLQRRRYLANRYERALADLPITLPFCAPKTVSAWHLYVIRISNEHFKLNREEIFNELRDKGIGVNLHYIPIHSQPYYQKMGFQWGDFPNAEHYYTEAISLPLHYEMTDTEQDFVCQSLRELLIPPK
jgi:UDP-4-amino-4,6-dideoxy-N-acetyl-beta-L-altrosamine transaminase